MWSIFPLGWLVQGSATSCHEAGLLGAGPQGLTPDGQVCGSKEQPLPVLTTVTWHMIGSLAFDCILRIVL